MNASNQALIASESSSQKTLIIFNWYTGKNLITIPLSEKVANEIVYLTHPNNPRKTCLYERPMSLAEILRMPSPMLKQLIFSLNPTLRNRFIVVINRAYTKKHLSAVAYQHAQNVISPKRKVKIKNKPRMPKVYLDLVELRGLIKKLHNILNVEDKKNEGQ